jgi:PAS domain S-box-containing protein
MTQAEPICILYIEDDPGLARLVQKRLGRAGYTVDIASDGEEGITRYKADSYDLLFVDQSLPIHDGLEVIRILRSNGSLPPTVMITGTGDERVAVEAMKLGASDYIVKDVEGGYLELLPSVVEKVLQQRRDVDERQRAQEAYQAVVEHSLQGLQIIQGGRKVFVNSAYAEMVGYTEEELLALSPEQTLDLVHPEDRELVGAHYRDRIAGKPAPQRYEFRIVQKDGSVRWVEVFASRIEYHGRPASQLAMIDITERKQAETALRESEEKYRELVERANDGITIIQDGIAKYVNPILAKMWGGTAQESTGTSFTDYIDPDELPKVVDRYNRRMKGEDVASIYETVLRRKDGSKVYVELNAGSITYQGKLADLVFVRDITERKQAEEALRIKDSAITSSINAIAIGEFGGNLTYVNHAFLKMWGYDSEKDVLGKPAVNFWHKKEKAQEVIEALLKGKNVVGELKAKRKDGSLFDVQLSASIVTDETGKPIYMMGSFVDITERKQVELELRESEERYRFIFENSQNVNILIGTDGKIIDVNEGAVQSLGYKKESVIGKDVLAFVVPEQRQAAAKQLAQELKGEYTPSFAVDVISKKGIRTLLFPEGHATVLATGRLTGMLLSALDITDRKQAEDSLRQSEERYRTLVENVDFGINLIDADHTIVMANAALSKRICKSVSEIIGKKCFRVFEKRDAVCPYCPGVQAMAAGRPAEIETEGVKDDPDLFPARLQAFPIFGQDGTVSGFIEVVEDITERKQVEKDIIEHKEALKNSFFGTAEALSKVIEDRDPYTSGHSAGVAGLGEAIARVMGFPEDELTGIYIAGVLHDIGKMAVPVEILVKPGKLTDMEISLIHIHPQAGYEILNGIDFPWPVALATLQHHERMDGSGYPQGLTGNKIILEARILAVADVVDAMTHHRPYRPAFSLQDAVEEINKGSGRIYDPQVVDACLEALEGRQPLVSSAYSTSSTSPQLLRGSTKSSTLPTTTKMRSSGRR